MKLKKRNKKPVVSVVMPVYNAEEYVAESIESILSQTYKNFEFIIVDDASKDNSFKIIKEYARKDKRIIALKNKRNLGVSKTIDRGLKIARGGYIARMDADDVSVPERLAKQVRYLERRTDVVAIGSQCDIIDKNGEAVGKKLFPLSHDEIYRYMFVFNPVQHPTLLIARNRLPEEFEYYDDSLDGAEDLDLLFKLFRYGRVENMRLHLLKYRVHTSNVSLNNVKSIFMQAFIARMKGVFKYGYHPTLMGWIITLAQAMVVTALPGDVVFWLYKKIRMVYDTSKRIQKVAASARFSLNA